MVEAMLGLKDKLLEWADDFEAMAATHKGLERTIWATRAEECRQALASPAPALPESGVEGVLKRHLRISIDQDWDGMKYAILGIEDAAREIEAALATTAPAPAPAPAPVDAAGLVARLVKPLEWQDAHEFAVWAETPIGDYRAYTDGTWKGRSEGGVEGRSLEAAKAAAQADYTARILSALDASALAAAAEREAALLSRKDFTAAAYERELRAAEARATAAEGERDRMRDAVEGSCHLLAMAIEAGDPTSELLFRVKEITTSIRKETADER